MKESHVGINLFDNISPEYLQQESFHKNATLLK